MLVHNLIMILLQNKNISGDIVYKNEITLMQIYTFVLEKI